MKILALVAESFGGMGGIAQSNAELLRAFAEEGHEVVVFPRLSEKRAESVPANIRFLPARKNSFIYSISSLKVLNEGRFDLIFCGHLFMSPLAAFLSKIAQVPFWIHLYGIEAWRRPSSLAKKAVKKARLVTAISRYTRRRFLSWANVSPERARLLPPAVDERFSPGPKSSEWLGRYRLAEKKVLLTVGRLSRSEGYKGQDKIIKVLPRLLESFSSLAYVIVGDGDDRPRLESLAKELGVERNVFFAGQADHSELPDIYRSADGFAMPSTGEGFGIVFLEASASGIPVLGGDCDGSPDALLDGRAGIMIDPANEEQLIDGLKKLIAQKSSEKMTVNCFSFQNFRHHIQRLLAEHIHEHPSRHS